MPFSTKQRLLRTLVLVDDERRRTAAVQGQLAQQESRAATLEAENADLRRRLNETKPQARRIEELEEERQQLAEKLARMEAAERLRLEATAPAKKEKAEKPEKKTPAKKAAKKAA